ncbi:ferritin-like protein [Streptomyces sp. T12]|uniref:ferritin-like domain-containing protein n=2 Tax=unclassified Streptomyces TaxID=2593676 RepID=UPI002365B471|nr:ferritin-like protein [Streptomyces sp. T12]WDF42233.1 ferritin-like protein [Streptomyces sp. T12]
MGEEPDEPAVSPFRRRTFLASAALATGAPGAVAGSAQAAGLPEGGPLAAPGLGSVARMLAVPEEGRGVAWLRSALQVAVGLELATIPPYLCGLWSVKDRGSEVARLIQRIVGDEMYHLGIVCNLLVAVGGRPQIKASAPVYPGPLPGGVRAGVTVYLSGLTKPFVRDVMMAIEAPEESLVRSARSSPTVGEFYAEVLKAFRVVQPELSVRGQLSQYVFSDDLQPVENLDHVERAIEIIREQGEGTASSPSESFEDDHPAHYYAFGEIYHGRELRETDDGWKYVGGPVPFPDVRPMAPLPVGGWPRPPAHVAGLLFRSDATYSTVLDTLDVAWAGGGHRTLSAAIHSMRALEGPAVELMETPLRYAPGTYGPQFRALRKPRRDA